MFDSKLSNHEMMMLKFLHIHGLSSEGLPQNKGERNDHKTFL